MAKCKWCGQEFNSINRQLYCSYRCYWEINSKRSIIRSFIKRIAKKFNLDVKNKNKIINAKILLFGKGDVKRCPCDAQNPERYCGSLRCLADIQNNGHCHCNLFHLKDKKDACDD